MKSTIQNQKLIESGGVPAPVREVKSRWRPVRKCLGTSQAFLSLLLLVAVCCSAGTAKADGDKQNGSTQQTRYTEMKLLWGTTDVQVFADPDPSDCNRNYLFTVYPYQNFYLWSGTTLTGLDSIMYYQRFKILRNGQTWDSIGYPNGWYGDAYFWENNKQLFAVDSPGNYEIIYEDYDAGFGWVETQHAYFTCIPQITKVWIEAEEYCAPFETAPADNKIHFRIKTEPSIATVMHYAPRYETGFKSPWGECLKDEEIRIGLDCKVQCPTLGYSYNVGSNFETVNNTYPNVFGAGVNDVNGSLWGTYDTTQQYEFWASYTDAGSVAAGYGEIADYFNGSFQGEPLVVHLHITDGDLLDQTFDAPIIITFPKGSTPANGLSAYHLGSYTLTQSETWTPEDNPVAKMYGAPHTTIKIRDSLEIPAGMQLTLQHVTLEFGPDGKTDVQTDPGSGGEGGYLLVDSGSTLTALDYCGDDTAFWQGIYVWGDATRNQGRFGPHGTGPSWQGVLEMRNNSEISYANWAVHNAGPIAFTGAAAGKRNNRNGGVIDVSDSRFVNNVRSVNLDPYPVPGIPVAGSRPITYNAWFRNTDFEVTVPLPSTFITGIAGWSVNGVGIAGCRFTNSATQANAYKSGIYGTDFGASVSDYKPYVSGPAIHSEFHDLDAGILLQNTGMMPTTAVVTNSLFDGNYYGVSLSGLPAPQLHGNSFTIPQGHGDPDEALGVFINTGSGYGVSFNSLTRSPGTTLNTGVLISNTGGDNNVVNSNTYNEVWCANLSNYLNRSSDGSTGLQFLCNFNSGNTHDIAARGRWQSMDGIRANQGLPTEAAGNTMSNSALFNIYNYTYEVQPINYYYSPGE